MFVNPVMGLFVLIGRFMHTTSNVMESAISGQ